MLVKSSLENIYATDGTDTTSLGKLFHRLTTLDEKKLDSQVCV